MIFSYHANNITQATVNKEIEQRYIVDPHRGLILPKNYLEYHQAEIGSGTAKEIITTFRERTNGLLTKEEIRTGRKIHSLFSTIKPAQLIKLRIRCIFNPRELSLRAEFTLKERFPNKDFKVYNEHNLPIHPTLALSLIEHIAPRFEGCDESPEHGVRKFRYNIPGPDGKMWDVDAHQGLNAGIYTGEIEVASLRVKIKPPTWAVKKINGNPDFKFLGTGELQRKPWIELSHELKQRYMKVLSCSTVSR